MAAESPTVVDLFCGAGGLSKGFLDAGFELACGVDSDEAAVETHRTNLGHHTVCRDVTERQQVCLR